MSIAVIAGIIELIARQNFAFNIIESIFSLEDFSIDADSVRFGLKRCNSIFSYFSTYGVATLISLIVFYIKYFKFGIGGRWTSLLVFLCAFAAFSTGSRAIFLGLFVALFTLFFDRKFLSSSIGGKFIFLIMMLSPLLMQIAYQVMDSIINSDTSKYASGSTSDLRLMQWEACYEYFLDSPWFGNGRMYIWDVVKEEHFELLGAESIWFSILVDYGLLGAVAFLYLIYACCKCLYSYNKRLIGLPVGYLLVLSLSPDTGIQYNILISFTILLIKMYQYLPHQNVTIK